jgi:anti-sigma regulatory factor (Ser/Thr protein kinase)
MTTAMLTDRIVITNTTDELPRMTAWLLDCAAAAELPPDLTFNLDVCLTEAVFNIISYAYDDARPHDIILELSRTGTGARVVIHDDGRPFNLLAASLPAVAATLEDARIGGLGIPLIRKMAHCHYQRIDGRNVLTLEVQHKPLSGHA